MTCKPLCVFALCWALLLACGDDDATGVTDAPSAVDTASDIVGTSDAPDAPADALVGTDTTGDDDAPGTDTTGDDDAPGTDDTDDDNAPDTTDVALTTVQPLTLTTTDGKSIAATSHRPSDPSEKAAGVVLIHQFTQNQAQWDPYLADLTGRGFHVLTLDLRGHGDSDPQDGSFNGLLTDPQGAPRDVRAAIEWLGGEGGADPDRIAVIGTSIGANLALVASARGYGVKLPVAVSARASSVASLADSDADSLTFSGLFILATADDGGGAQADTAEAFHDQSSEPRKKMTWPGASHGMTLLSTIPDAWPQVLAWLDSYL